VCHTPLISNFESLVILQVQASGTLNLSGTILHELVGEIVRTDYSKVLEKFDRYFKVCKKIHLRMNVL